MFPGNKKIFFFAEKIVVWRSHRAAALSPDSKFQLGQLQLKLKAEGSAFTSPHHCPNPTGRRRRAEGETITKTGREVERLPSEGQRRTSHSSRIRIGINPGPTGGLFKLIRKKQQKTAKYLT